HTLRGRRRPRGDRAALPQPADERARGDTAAGDAARRARGDRRPRGGDRAGHGARCAVRAARARLRAVLHDQATWLRSRSGHLHRDRAEARRAAPDREPARRGRRLHGGLPARRGRARAGVNTVLLVTPDDALRTRLLGTLEDYSAFIAQSDAEAFKILRLIEVDVVLRDCAGLLQGLEAFIARVKEVTPAALTIALGAAEDEGHLADFTLPATFTPRDLDGALRHAQERLRLTRELATLRSSAAVEARAPATSAEEPWDGVALARALKEFTRAFAAGFDLPRVFAMFLDAIGELVRSTRTALLLPGDDGRDYRVVAHRGLAPRI